MSTSPDASSLNLRTVAPKRRLNPLLAVPNLLTLMRMVLLPFLVVAVVHRKFGLAFGMFIVAAVTDAIDGLLARWLRQSTMLGQYLDPIADKLLLSSLFIVFTRMGILDLKIAVLVFGRDLGMLLTALMLYLLVGLRDFHPTLLGKANSVSQVLAIGMVLLSLIYPESWVNLGRAVMLDVTILVTIASGFHYALVASKRIGEITDTAPARLDPATHL